MIARNFVRFGGTCVLPLLGVGVLALFVVLQGHGGRSSLELWVVAAGGALAVITRVSLEDLGLVFTGLFVSSASWDTVTIGSAKLRAVLLLLAAAFMLASQGLRMTRLPWWIHVYVIAALTVTAVQFVLPVSRVYLAHRYDLHPAGVALGERPGTIPVLLSLVFNAYVVTGVVALAGKSRAGALPGLVGFYVCGAAASALAGFLGFEGFPHLLNAAGQLPSGVRAVGYTSHPLHLATASLMALGPACWLATRQRSILTWAGRVALPVLLLGIYASGSRAAAACTAVVLAACVLLVPPMRGRMYTILSGVGMSLALMVLLLPSLGFEVLKTTRLYGVENVQVSDDGRGQVLAQGLLDFAHSPIYGIGVRFLAEAHVLYVSLLATGGVVLFLGFVLMQSGAFRELRATAVLMPGLAGALLATLIMSWAYWFMAFEFQTAPVQVIFGLAVAASAAVRCAGRDVVSLADRGQVAPAGLSEAR